MTSKISKLFTKEETRKLFKPFILLFIINLLIINWNDIAWMFNYRMISGILSNFVKKDSNKIDDIVNLQKINHFDKENTLEIPKLELVAPLIVVESSNKTDLNDELDRGVVLFPNSTLPGHAGQTIILGHSAPTNWPKTKYDWVFSRLNELKEEDEIIFYFNQQKYTYRIKKKSFLNKGEEIPNSSIYTEDTLLLISCWPPGTNLKRIIVEATLNKI